MPLTIVLILLMASVTLSANPIALAKSRGGDLKQIPSEITDYPDNNPNAIEVKTFKASKDIIKTWHVRGEVTNKGTDTLEYVKVTAHLFDSNSQPIGTAWTYVDPTSLESGHTGNFEALVDAKELSEKPTTYRLSFDW